MCPLMLGLVSLRRFGSVLLPLQLRGAIFNENLFAAGLVHNLATYFIK